MSTPKNCHYISRFLTKSWETDERILVYYDFRTDRIERRSSRALFARDRLNDPDIERRLNALMETPMSAQREIIVTGKTDPPDWRAYRAIALLLMLQAPRSIAALSPLDYGDRLAEFLRLPENELDQLIELWLDRHHLIRYAVPPSERLFFPSTGVFALPVTDRAKPSHFDFAFAVPIHPRVFIAYVSETADVDGIAQHVQDGVYHAAASVGLHSDIVLVPPDLLSSNSEENLCKSIRSWRQGSRELVAHVVKARELMSAVHQRYGVKLDAEGALKRAAADE
jgi:hypothetical protein